jgi:hypothetical protein
LSSRLLSKNTEIREGIIILTVILNGCETWSFTARINYRLGVFKNRVLKKRFGAKGVEVTLGCGKLQNEELHNLYYSPHITRMI